MQGPYNLISSEIDINVKQEAGAYVLTNVNNVAVYVGRADSDLNARLKSHLSQNETNICITRSGVKSFYFENASSLEDAYNLECEWYHKYRPTCNMAHPAKNLPSWFCRVCGL
jgi:excinuclease UvrABC nuclease subunit